MKVEIIGANSGIENKVNEFLKENENYIVVKDIKYSTTYDFREDSIYQFVMIIYSGELKHEREKKIESFKYAIKNLEDDNYVLKEIIKDKIEDFDWQKYAKIREQKLESRAKN
ncbi:MAG: hypothetical protein SOV85_01895 [Clostridium sp.]|uniref:hypothetical protein n=1 Tax=Clostridium sp. TaxID=1506 RepID=UPI002A75C8A9|nr:hypothetical protein [Clostridium sp.]MDY2630096.1 hypothetical protein [Clostridium sp.]